MLVLDHLAVASMTLEEGQSWVEEALGVALAPGGEHAYFGTHNMLLGLEDGLYLEVIAINPDAEPESSPRWFDLDRFHGAPRVSNWICRSDNLTALVNDFPEAGRPVALTRGDLNWRMAVPDTGILPFDNCFPALIQWDSKDHPAVRLPASGCRLERLIIHHPRAEDLASTLSVKLHDPRIVYEVGESRLSTEIATPDGRKVTL